MDEPLVSITYKTADGSRICVEVTPPVKELLEQSDRQIRSQRRQDRRYRDNRELINGLTDADMRLPEQSDTADLVMKSEGYERLRAAINELSEVQRRRLMLHFDEDKTYRQIAAMEGINPSAIGSSIKRAIAQLRKRLSD